MGQLYPVAGMRIYIGDAPMGVSANDLTVSDFPSSGPNSIDWVEIDGWTNCGPMGDTATLITQEIINRGRDAKIKGTANAPSMENQFVPIADDAGQIALIAAGVPSNKNNYPFRIVMNDAPVGGTPSERLFVGLVMGTSEQGGTANTARLMSGTIEINSNIVTVPATEDDS